MKTISEPQLSAKTQRHLSWDGCDLVSTEENIADGIEWTINDNRHAVIVHLGGTMTALETELDGYGMSFSPANAGEIWIVPANSQYAARANGAVIQYGVFFLDPSVVGQLVSSNADFGAISPLHGIRDEFCYYVVRKLIAASQSDDDVSTLLSESIRNALCLHLFQIYGNGSEPLSEANKLVLNKRSIEVLRAYIHKHVAEKMTLSTLSNLVGMRTNPFLIAFRRAFGQTPAQYIIAQRLRRAQWLLANSSDDITHVALEAGFSSHSHLSTVFKKHFDKTPSEYRMRCKGKAVITSPHHRMKNEA